MLKKFLSRKLLIVFLTAVCDFLVASGGLDPAIKDLLIKLITALGSLYISIEGIRDMIIAIKNKLP